MVDGKKLIVINFLMWIIPLIPAVFVAAIGFSNTFEFVVYCVSWVLNLIVNGDFYNKWVKGYV